MAGTGERLGFQRGPAVPGSWPAEVPKLPLSGVGHSERWEGGERKGGGRWGSVNSQAELGD